MGKITGFLEFQRQAETYQPASDRVHHYNEFVAAFTDGAAQTEGARCMDCGIPFCNNGCPIHNLIPDWNDLVFRNAWQEAAEVLHATNNFPEFTGRICPAPCEAACTLGINAEPVGIKSIEHFIADKAWQAGWVTPRPASRKTGKTVAVVGSGPAGLAAAQQLARAGHSVTVFEKNDQPGGLLRYGIPNFKLDKTIIDRRLAQLAAEGVVFRNNTLIGVESLPVGVASQADTYIDAKTLTSSFDAVILSGGAEMPRDLPIAGRDLTGVYFAMEYLVGQTQALYSHRDNPISAKDKRVIVIGGGDTGSDCVGTANRQGARSVTQFEVMPQPPEQENKPLTWPYWPIKLRTSSSHEEGCERQFAVSTEAFVGDQGRLKALKTIRLAWQGGKTTPIAGSEETLEADLVFLAMGFTRPLASLLQAFGLDEDPRGNAKASTDGKQAYASSVPGVFVAGDMRRGQSLVVWAIREGRQCAHSVDRYLRGGNSQLPR